LCEKIINKIDDTLDTESFQNILKNFQVIFEKSEGITDNDLQKLKELFQNVGFLHCFVDHMKNEIISIYGNGNTDAFDRLAFL
jgi:hypothetical protein